jgi:SAM-dependent methyltransferase
MGFDTSAIKFLLSGKEQGVNFKKTLTLGRHSYQLDDYALGQCLKQFGIDPAQVAKLKAESPVYVEPFLKLLGAKTTDSMDASSYEDATHIHDLNAPLPAHLKQQYDVVIDAGTLEHVFNFPQAIQNAMQMVKTGGTFISITIANNFFGHGFYQFSPELFYRVLSPENGFKMERMYFTITEPDAHWYEVPDPKVVKSRVTLENTRQSYLLIQATKVEEKALFTITPQQSDYEYIAWGNNNNEQQARKHFLAPVAKLLPASLKNMIRQLRHKYNKRKLNVLLNQYGNGNKHFFKRVN